MSGSELNSATIRGDLAAVEKLLADGASPDFSDASHNGARPLHRCAWRGFPEIAELLLGHGRQPKLQERNGATP